MPATKSHAVKIRLGEWTDAKGQTHGRFRTIGAGFTDDDGKVFLRLHAESLNPMLAAMSRKKGEDSVLINLWPEDNDKPATPADPEEDDDISFAR